MHGNRHRRFASLPNEMVEKAARHVHRLLDDQTQMLDQDGTWCSGTNICPVDTFSVRPQLGLILIWDVVWVDRRCERQIRHRKVGRDREHSEEASGAARSLGARAYRGASGAARCQKTTQVDEHN